MNQSMSLDDRKTDEDPQPATKIERLKTLPKSAIHLESTPSLHAQSKQNLCEAKRWMSFLSL